MKLVIHEDKQGAPKVELFDLKTDPAEKNNVALARAADVERLKEEMRQWQKSVLKSVSGEDY